MKKARRVRANYKLNTNTMSEINLKQLEIKTIQLQIEGTAPLIVHNWSEKAKRQMLEKQMGKARVKKHDIKDPEADYQATLYKIDSKKTGFPATGFKAASVRAGKALGYSMTDLRGWMFVIPDNGDLVEIKGKHHMREDMVRVSNGSPDIRFRAEYQKWSAKLTIQYNAGSITADEIGQIVMAAGFSCGIGEWRPEKSATGSYGTWQLK